MTGFGAAEGPVLGEVLAAALDEAADASDDDVVLDAPAGAVPDPPDGSPDGVAVV